MKTFHRLKRGFFILNKAPENGAAWTALRTLAWLTVLIVPFTLISIWFLGIEPPIHLIYMCFAGVLIYLALLPLAFFYFLGKPVAHLGS